ncbi:MAG: hypothetical protein M3N93_07690 [Acidobacteriota bacterium]|nr:hypothetical protein [Acidobacteriota bacterium]
MTHEQILSLREELKRDIEALDRVERIIAAKDAVAKSDERQIPLPIRSVAADQDLDESPVTSLRGTIAATINSDTTVKWTTSKMLSHLEKTGYPLKAKKPIYSVGQTMQILAEQGKIRLVRRGAGSAPNIYRGVEKNLEQNTGSKPEDESKGGMLPLAG